MRKIFIIILLLIFGSREIQADPQNIKISSLKILNDSIDKLLLSTLSEEGVQKLSTIVVESLKILKDVSPKESEYKRTFVNYASVADALSNAQKHVKMEDLLLPISQFSSDSSNYELAIVNYYLGRSYLLIGDTKNAEQFYLKAIDILEVKDDEVLHKLYSNLGVVYKRKGHFKESIEYYRKSLAIKRISYPNTVSKIYSNLSSIYMNLGNIDSSYANVLRCLANTQDLNILHHAYTNLGRVYEYNGLYHADCSLYFFHEAKKSHQEALNIRKTLKDTSSFANSYFNLGVIYEYLGQYVDAEKSYELAMSYDEENVWSQDKIEVRENLAEVYFIRGKYNQAINHIKDLKKLLTNREPSILPQGEQGFLLEKLDRKLSIYQAENIKWLAIITASILGLVCIILMYITFRERLRRLKIQNTLIQNKTLFGQKLVDVRDKVLYAVALDLHEGLQNYIYAWKLTLCESTEIRTIKKLDKLSEEIRRIAHRLKPISLMNGIMPALKELQNECNGVYPFKIVLNSSSMEQRRFSSSVELCVYRIVQEAQINVFRHAKAKEMTIQLIYHVGEQYISLIIEDNGKGIEDKPTGDGMGLSGMRDRVEALRGNFDIDSSPGRGTTIIADIPAEIKRLENNS